jgi:hypothetical protein
VQRAPLATSEAAREAFAHVSALPSLGALPQGPDKGGSHSYCRIPGNTFQVRGPRYHIDKVKVASSAAAFSLMFVEMFRSVSRVGNVAARRRGWLRKARDAGDRRFYLVVNYVTPALPYIHAIFYYAVDEARLASSPHLHRLWQRFTAHGPAADAFRNERWKVIPRIPEGSWIVQKTVGSKPTLLGTKLTHTWILQSSSSSASSGSQSGEIATAAATAASSASGDGPGGPSPSSGSTPAAQVDLGPYLESDCDVASSSVAQAIVGVIQQYAKLVVIDLAFAIEGREADELPEVVLGTVRMSRLEVSQMPVIEALPSDEVLGRPGELHGEHR